MVLPLKPPPKEYRWQMHHSFTQQAGLGARLWDITVNKTDKVLVPMTFICWGGTEKVFISPGFPLYALHFSAKPCHFRGLGEQDYREGRDLCCILDAEHMFVKLNRAGILAGSPCRAGWGGKRATFPFPTSPSDTICFVRSSHLDCRQRLRAQLSQLLSLIA